MDARSAAFQAAMAASLETFRTDPRVVRVFGYAETGDPRFISRTGDAAYALVDLTMSDNDATNVVDELTAKLMPPAGMRVDLTGLGPLTRDFARQSEEDIRRAETVSLPLAAIILVLAFGSMVAAGMPLLVAGLAIPTTLALVWLAAQRLEMSVYALNIATMLGLALAIDYSLFLVSRFREELAAGHDAEAALERTVGTAGKAVAFSGAAVAIGLSGLLWFAAPALSSIGIAGSLTVLCTVLYSLTFLPALLGVLGHRANALSATSLLRRRRRGDGGGGVAGPAGGSRWDRVARGVMARPWAVLVPVLAGLVLAGSPFFHLEQGVPDALSFPAGLPSRETYLAIRSDFPLGDATSITVLAELPRPASDPDSIRAVMELSRRLEAIEGIDGVEQPYAIVDPATGGAWRPTRSSSSSPSRRRRGPPASGDCPRRSSAGPRSA